MTFGELTNYVLEMSGVIPEDAKIKMETDCCDEMGIIWWNLDHARFENGRVILSEVEK